MNIIMCKICSKHSKDGDCRQCSVLILTSCQSCKKVNERCDAGSIVPGPLKETTYHITALRYIQSGRYVWCSGGRKGDYGRDTHTHTFSDNSSHDSGWPMQLSSKKPCPLWSSHKCLLPLWPMAAPPTQALPHTHTTPILQGEDDYC